MRKISVLLAEFQNVRFASRALKECESLEKNNYRIRLLMYNSSIINKIVLNEPNIVYEQFPFPQVLKNTSFLTRSLRYYFGILTLIKMAYRIVITRSEIYHMNDLQLLLPGIIASRIYHGKLVYDAHEIHSAIHPINSQKGKILNKFNYYFERFALKSVDLFIQASEERSDYAVKVFNIKRPLVIENYVNKKIPDPKFPTIRRRLKLKSTDKILIYVGGMKIGGNRRPEVIIQAIESLGEIYHFVLIGPKTERDEMILKRIADEMGISKQVHFVEAVKPKDVVSAIASADLSVIPLYADSLNAKYSALTKLSESCMAGLPIACSNYNNLNNIVYKNKIGPIGKTFDVTSVESVKEAILYCLETSRNRRFRKNAKALASSILNWEHEEEKLIKAYKNL